MTDHYKRPGQTDQDQKCTFICGVETGNTGLIFYALLS